MSYTSDNMLVRAVIDQRLERRRGTWAPIRRRRLTRRSRRPAGLTPEGGVGA